MLPSDQVPSLDVVEKHPILLRYLEVNLFDVETLASR